MLLHTGGADAALDLEVRRGVQTPLTARVSVQVESFVEGEFFHIDGLMLNGDLKICWPRWDAILPRGADSSLARSRYVNTVAEFAANGFIAAYSLATTDPLVKRLQEYIAKARQFQGGCH